MSITFLDLERSRGVGRYCYHHHSDCGLLAASDGHALIRARAVGEGVTGRLQVTERWFSKGLRQLPVKLKSFISGPSVHHTRYDVCITPKFPNDT